MFVGVILLTAVVFADTTDSADTTAFADSTALADSTVADSAAVDSAALLLTEKLLGDVSDGSRAVPVHRIPLYTEQGEKILPNDDVVLPFSTRRTCGDCHNYNVVKTGWHFNSMDSTVQPGRPGEPWVLVDAGTGTQLPLSYRNWPGTFRPEQLDITPWKFTQLFGSHMPGGGPGEVDSTVPEEIVRGFVSGKLEINCLSCHDADPRHDQAEYATQIVRQNFRWAAAATCGFASVSGSARSMDDTYDPFMPPIIDNPTVQPPAISYKKGIFDSKKRVFFDIRRKAPAERCYFCHSTHDLDEGNGEKWEADTDVHLAAGLTCTDCHRNGVDHAIVRGYEKESEISDNPLAASMTCQGCHLGSDDSGSKPARGRLGAPVPEHPGLPLVHFEKLSCTACHSGPWPDKKPHQIKTSMAHKLGTHGVLKTRDVLPHIYAPVFVKNEENKIAPHKLIWP
ncbi:MAG TPA: hypothetical protein EYP04_03635, partial [Anaerolineae bacterium]|nr:hypothetical protein [Anaerolineae bacterium]